MMPQNRRESKRKRGGFAGISLHRASAPETCPPCCDQICQPGGALVVRTGARYPAAPASLPPRIPAAPDPGVAGKWQSSPFVFCKASFKASRHQTVSGWSAAFAAAFTEAYMSGVMVTEQWMRFSTIFLLLPPTGKMRYVATCAASSGFIPRQRFVKPMKAVFVRFRVVGFTCRIRKL